MNRLRFLSIIIIFVISALFVSPFLSQNKLPIPSDTIIGLYHPFRDLYAGQYPNGIPYKNFLITDPVRQQYPWRKLAIENFKEFQLPLWNPYSFSGAPLLANFQSAAFYPLNILFFVLPLSLGWSILVVLQPFLAGIFLYLFLRNLKINKPASILGGITFAFSGFMTAWFTWGTIGHTGLWLPLTLLSIDKLISSKKHKVLSLKSRPNLAWSLIFLFSLVSSFFAGHLQSFFYLFIVSIFYLFFRLWKSNNRKAIIFTFLILNSCFLILTIVQWLPTLNFILSSARGVDQVWQRAGWFIPWQNIVQFVSPDFFGNPATLNYWGEFNYAEFIGYVGIFPLLMSLFALTSGRSRDTIFFGVVLILSLVLAFPTFIAKVPYLLQIPFLSTSQPTRMLFLADFSLSVLAGFGLDILMRQGKKSKLILPILFITFIISVLWYFVIAGHKMFPLISLENVLVAKRNMYLPTLLLVLSVAGLAAYTFIKNIKYKYIIVFFLILITLFDLYRFFHKFTPFIDKSYLYPVTSSLSFLQEQDGVFRIMTTDDRIMPPNFSAMYQLQSIDGYDPLYLLSYGELMASLKRGKPDISSPFGFNRIISVHNVDSRLIDLLGVRYVLSFDELSSAKLKKVFTEGKTNVYENTQAYERAFFVSSILPAVNKNEAIVKMFDPNLDFKETAVVQDWDMRNKSFALGQANIVKYEDNRIEIDVENKSDGFLVLMDTHYPSWNARVCSPEGKTCRETKIYLTNYNFRGVIVPKGEHKVVFDINLL